MRHHPAAFLALAVLAGCHKGTQSEAGAQPSGFLGVRRTASLTAPSGSPSPEVSGSASVMGNADSTQTRIEVSLSNAAPNGKLPWHLHRGTCGNDQGIVGDASAYRPIAVTRSGTGTSTAVVNVPLPSSGEYMVNVHASANALGVIVACGNLGSGKE